MKAGKPLLLGAAVLVLAVAAATALWWGSGGAQIGGAALLVPGVDLTDAAREPISIDRTEPIPMTVYLDPSCGCCSGWVEHAAANGFEVTVEYPADLAAVKERLGVTPELSSCHTAVVNGYVVEGHVPAEVVRTFLAEAPAVAGLAAPGMPVGSPGMEMGDQRDAYDVLAFTRDGGTRVYSRQGR